METEQIPKKKTTPARRRRSSKGKHYFTKVHENAIIDFAKSDVKEEREVLYRSLIAPVFDELVEKIVCTYKFTSLPNIDSLKDECKTDLATILSKFDPAKGSKAFSYFSVITKNWFIQKTKKNTKQREREVYLEDVSLSSEHLNLSEENSYHDLRESKEFIELLKVEMKYWNYVDMKENEKKVVDAIEVLFDSAEQIPVFNKKAIYWYLREITGLNTKQVVNVLKKLRCQYSEFRDEWDEGNI